MRSTTRFILVLTILVLSGLPFLPSTAAERGTKREAIELVKTALDHIAKAGLPQALLDFQQPTDNVFRNKDLYVFVYDYAGNNLANSADLKLPGRNLLNFRTTDGKLVIQEMIQMSRSNGGGALPYHFVNPLTHEVEPKISYFRKIPDFDGFIGCGYYEVDEADDKKASQALLRRAMNHIREVGLERALRDFKQHANVFHEGDLYVFVYDYAGNNLANTVALPLPSTQLKDFRTVDGKYVIQQMIEMTRANGGGALQYEMLNPETNETQPKISYFKKIPDFEGFIGSGYYYQR